MNKKFYIIIPLLICLSYFGFTKVKANYQQKQIAKMESTLFPLIHKLDLSEKVSCDPAFITYRESELYIYCHPLKNTEDNDLVNHLRAKVEQTAKLWASKNKIKTNYIKTRFTNEIIVLGKK